MAVTLRGEAVPTSLESSSPFRGARSSYGSLSSASRTFPPAASEASYATSHTDYTVIFSQQDGSLLPEQRKRPLDPVMKARKLLMRYLEQCSGDCRTRKVKCSLSHHALADILDGEHDEQAEFDVRWALEYESETRGSDAVSAAHEYQGVYGTGEDDMLDEQEPSITQRAVIDDAANKFDMRATPDSIYPSTISEGDLLEESVPEPAELAHYVHPYTNISFQYFDQVFLPQQQFSTVKTPRTLSLATEMLGFSSNGSFLYYQCLCYPENCRQIFHTPQDLLNHTRLHHRGFVPLFPDPMRLVCPNCLEFYFVNSMSGICSNFQCSSPRRLVVNICGELYLEGEVPCVGRENILTGPTSPTAYGMYDLPFY